VNENSKAAGSRVALVTGATRGIGRAIATALAADGLRVVGTATTGAGAAAITEALAAHGGKGVVLNVTDSVALNAVIEAVTEEFGGLHVLVNNAGITRDTLSMRMKDDDWDAVIDTNLKAVFRACRAVTKPMLRQRWGRIINITSVVGVSGNAGQVNYAAAKAGVAGLTRSLARELAPRQITVNCVAPGFIATDMTDHLPEAAKTALLAGVPLGRLGSAEEVAAAVVFLASAQAGYITGTELHVNGGMVMT
jgi:3-oxoacyl-[acyl-carrier protein] reductase